MELKGTQIISIFFPLHFLSISFSTADVRLIFPVLPGEILVDWSRSYLYCEIKRLAGERIENIRKKAIRCTKQISATLHCTAPSLGHLSDWNLASGPKSSYSYCLSSTLLGKILQCTCKAFCGEKCQGKEGGTPVLWESIWVLQFQELPIPLSRLKISTCFFSYCVALGSRARLCNEGVIHCCTGWGYFNCFASHLQKCRQLHWQKVKGETRIRKVSCKLCAWVWLCQDAAAVVRSGHLSALGHPRSHLRPGIFTKVLIRTRSAT